MAWWLLWPVNFDKIQNHLGDTSSGMSVKVTSGRFNWGGRQLLEGTILSGGRYAWAKREREATSRLPATTRLCFLTMGVCVPPHTPARARPPYHDGPKTMRQNNPPSLWNLCYYWVCAWVMSEGSSVELALSSNLYVGSTCRAILLVSKPFASCLCQEFCHSHEKSYTQEQHLSSPRSREAH